MSQIDKTINIKLIGFTIVFLSTLILFPTNKSLSEPKTWDDLAERKNLFFENSKILLSMEKSRFIGQMAILKKLE